MRRQARTAMVTDFPINVIEIFFKYNINFISVCFQTNNFASRLHVYMTTMLA
jgi:hypothetical protein